MSSNQRDENRIANISGVSSITFTGTIEPAVNPSTHGLLVELSSGGVDQDVNLVSVSGTAFNLGQQLATSSLPVVLTAAQISTLTPLSTVAVTQSTSPWVISGAVTNTVLSVVGGGTEATAQRVTIANDSTGVLTVKQATGSNLHTVVDSGTITTVSTITAVTSITNPVSTKTALTASSPTAASVGTSSAQAVAAAATRKGLILTNTSANKISLGFGATAVLNSGVTLYPGGVFVMDEYNFHVGAINAIAGGAASNLAVQEFTT